MEFLQQHWLQVINFFVELGFIKVFWNVYKDRKKRSNAMNNGMRSILRAEIKNICIKAEEKGYLPVYAVESLNDMFSAYSALGGNGAIKELYLATLRLPHIQTKKE